MSNWIAVHAPGCRPLAIATRDGERIVSYRESPVLTGDTIILVNADDWEDEETVLFLRALTELRETVLADIGERIVAELEQREGITPP
jgi:hypothetical protein